MAYLSSSNADFSYDGLSLETVFGPFRFFWDDFLHELVPIPFPFGDGWVTAQKLIVFQRS